jgi:hypothetical protein
VLVAVAVLSAPIDAQEVPDAGVAPDAAPLRGPTPCFIDGRVAITGLEVVRRSRHGHDTIGRVDLPPREIRLEVLTPSRFRVSTREGEPAITGHTRVRPPLSLRRDLALGGVLARRGAPITRTTPREQALDVDVDLGSGVLLRRVALGCDALRVRAPTAPEGEGAPSPHQPHWRSHGRELAIRERPEEGIEVARLLAPQALVLDELARREPFVRVRARLPYAAIDGWVRDSALVPAR